MRGYVRVYVCMHAQLTVSSPVTVEIFATSESAKAPVLRKGQELGTVPAEGLGAEKKNPSPESVCAASRV